MIFDDVRVIKLLHYLNLFYLLICGRIMLLDCQFLESIVSVIRGTADYLVDLPEVSTRDFVVKGIFLLEFIQGAFLHQGWGGWCSYPTFDLL
jgi:hypothetical protein